MKILFVDTSQKKCTVALFAKEEEWIATFFETKALFTNIRAVMADSGLNLLDVDHFIVGAGPGSYTGIRVGAAALQAIAFALGKQAIFIDSLALYYENSPVIVDARRGGFYYFEGKSSEVLSEPQLLNKLAIYKEAVTPTRLVLEERLLALGYPGALFEKELQPALLRDRLIEAVINPEKRVSEVLYLKKTEAERKLLGGS